MTTTIPDPQVYRAAADVIRENGWYQGHFFDDSLNTCSGQLKLPLAKLPVCLLGAINVALSGQPIMPEGNDEAALSVKTWLRDLVDGPSLGKLPTWNDAPDRTVDDVLALLERAASAAESALAAQDGGEGRG